MAVDPVCGMTVSEAAAAGSTVRDGRSYFFCSEQCLNKFRADPAQFVTAHAAGDASATRRHDMTAAATPRVESGKELAKDPICGMMVDKVTALKSERGGRAYYFCSVGCQKTFESPEQALKSMRTLALFLVCPAILLWGAFKRRRKNGIER